MTPEQKLAALFAAETPPARDFAFQAVLARRIAARRAWMTVAALIPWTIAATALLWGLRPVVAPLAEGLAAALQPTAMVLVTALAAGLAARWLSRRFSAVRASPPPRNDPTDIRRRPGRLRSPRRRLR